jgi:hypothetical protein
MSLEEFQGRDGVLLFCGGGKEDRTPDLNAASVALEASRVHIRVQHSKIHNLKTKENLLSDV